jgi:hypothetical protein
MKQGQPSFVDPVPYWACSPTPRPAMTPGIKVRGKNNVDYMYCRNDTGDTAEEGTIVWIEDQTYNFYKVAGKNYKQAIIEEVWVDTMHTSFGAIPHGYWCLIALYTPAVPISDAADGTVKSVNSIEPDENGNVSLVSYDIPYGRLPTAKRGATDKQSTVGLELDELSLQISDNMKDIEVLDDIKSDKYPKVITLNNAYGVQFLGYKGAEIVNFVNINQLTQDQLKTCFEEGGTPFIYSEVKNVDGSGSDLCALVVTDKDYGGNPVGTDTQRTLFLKAGTGIPFGQNFMLPEVAHFTITKHDDGTFSAGEIVYNRPQVCDFTSDKSLLVSWQAGTSFVPDLTSFIEVAIDDSFIVKTVNSIQPDVNGNIALGDLDSSWGKIDGTLSDQKDLQAALDKKADTLILPADSLYDIASKLTPDGSGIYTSSADYYFKGLTPPASTTWDSDWDDFVNITDGDAIFDVYNVDEKGNYYIDVLLTTETLTDGSTEYKIDVCWTSWTDWDSQGAANPPFWSIWIIKHTDNTVKIVEDPNGNNVDNKKLLFVDKGFDGLDNPISKFMFFAKLYDFNAVLSDVDNLDEKKADNSIKTLYDVVNIIQSGGKITEPDDTSQWKMISVDVPPYTNGISIYSSDYLEWDKLFIDSAENYLLTSTGRITFERHVFNNGMGGSIIEYMMWHVNATSGLKLACFDMAISVDDDGTLNATSSDPNVRDGTLPFPDIIGVHLASNISKETLSRIKMILGDVNCAWNNYMTRCLDQKTSNKSEIYNIVNYDNPPTIYTGAASLNIVKVVQEDFEDIVTMTTAVDLNFNASDGTNLAKLEFLYTAIDDNDGTLLITYTNYTNPSSSGGIDYGKQVLFKQNIAKDDDGSYSFIGEPKINQLPYVNTDIAPETTWQIVNNSGHDFGWFGAGEIQKIDCRYNYDRTTALNTVVENNKTKIQTNVTNIELNKENIAANTAQISTNTGDISATQDQITTVSTRVGTLSQNIISMKQTVDNNSSQIALNSGNIATNTKDITNLSNEIAGKGNVNTVNNTQPDSSGNVDVDTKSGAGNVFQWGGQFPANNPTLQSPVTVPVANCIVWAAGMVLRGDSRDMGALVVDSMGAIGIILHVESGNYSVLKITFNPA